MLTTRRALRSCFPQRGRRPLDAAGMAVYFPDDYREQVMFLDSKVRAGQ